MWGYVSYITIDRPPPAFVSQYMVSQWACACGLSFVKSVNMKELCPCMALLWYYSTEQVMMPYHNVSILSSFPITEGTLLRCCQEGHDIFVMVRAVSITTISGRYLTPFVSTIWKHTNIYNRSYVYSLRRDSIIFLGWTTPEIQKRLYVFYNAHTGSIVPSIVCCLFKIIGTYLAEFSRCI